MLRDDTLRWKTIRSAVKDGWGAVARLVVILTVPPSVAVALACLLGLPR